MCGRIVQSDTSEDLVALTGIKRGADCLFDAEPSYNVAPGSRITGLRINGPRGAEWDTFMWGILPAWSKGKHPVINARLETVTQKPMFRNAFQSRRSVIPVTAYYEWQSVSGSKQPYCIRTRNRFPLLLAGLYTENECVIITRTARSDISFIHDRMPVILNLEMAVIYLHRADMAYEIIAEENPLELDIYPVTKKIGNPTFNDPQCLTPFDRE